MLTYHSWTLVGYPEDPLAVTEWDANTSVMIEGFLQSLHSLIRGQAKPPVAAFLQAHLTPPTIASPYQRLRYWFLMGRAYIICRQWDDALAAFAMCAQCGLEVTAIMQIHLLRSWAYAAQEAHEHDVAFMKYERLAELVVTLLDQGQQDFIQQDAYCFLCNIYRNQAYARLWVCAPGAARKILEEDALPLLERYQLSFAILSSDQDESNWRELHVYVLWVLSMAITWQVRLSDAPAQFAKDLYVADEYILTAAKISRTFPEGKDWMANLYYFAAEMCLMRCDLANNRGMQTMLCDLAEVYLERGEAVRNDDVTTAEGRLAAMTLDFTRYELEVRKHIIFDTIDRMDDTLNRLIALREQTEGVDDPSYRLFTARCHLLLGNIEMTLQQFARHDDVSHARRAQAYLQQGLDFVSRRPDATLDGLFEREILLKMQQVEAWLTCE